MTKLNEIEPVDLNDIEPVELNDIEPIELDTMQEQEQEPEKEQVHPLITFVDTDKYFSVADDYVTVKIQKPKKNKAGELVEKVTIRKPRLGDTRRVNAGSYRDDDDKTLALTMQLSGLEVEFFNKLDIDDTDRIWAATKYFLLKRPMTMQVLAKMR